MTVEHLENVAADEKDKNASLADRLLKKLKDVKFMKFLYFMMDFMAVLANLSRQMQSDQLLLTDVKSEINDCTLKLLTMKTVEGESESQFKSNFNEATNELTHGSGVVLLRNSQARSSCQQSTETDHNVDISDLKAGIIDKTVEYIDARFAAFDEEPLSLFRVFDCREWPTSREQLATFGNNEIRSITRIFKTVLEDTETEQAILSSWSSLKSRGKDLAEKARNSQDVLSFYVKMHQLNLSSLVAINRLVKLMLTISDSTAAVERGFSTLNRIKTPQRSQMSQECLRNHMIVSMNTPEVGVFNASKRVVQIWMDTGKGTRHVHGHKVQQTSQ